MFKQELTQEEIVILKKMANKYKLTQPDFIIKGGMADIAHQVCSKHEITIQDLKSKERTRHFVTARVEFTKRCCNEINKSMNAVGRFLNRDHTTIIYYRNYE